MGGFIERAPEHRAHTHILARMRAADKSLSLIRWTCLFRPALCRRNHPTRNRVNCGGNLGCMMWTETFRFLSQRRTDISILSSSSLSLESLQINEELDNIEMSVLRSEEHTSELQSPDHLVCRLLLEKKKK